MKKKALLISFLLLSCFLSGCFSDEEEPNRFSWAEKEEVFCDTSNQSKYQCKLYLDGFTTPIKSLKHPLTNELWIADLNGEITSWNGQETRLVANLSSIISLCHIEQGLLGFSFVEDFTNNSKVLLSYIESVSCSGDAGALILSQANVVGGLIDIQSIEQLRRIEQPYRNHNGGHILSIGNNQYLWSVGDGGGSNDPNDNGQNSESPLGTIQFIEYSNNTIKPAINTTGQDSDYTLHHGLRNPWRFDVDPMNRIWIADVGQYCFEEINMVDLLDPTNFGWSTREGMHEFDKDSDCTQAPTTPPENLTDPLIEYNHLTGDCSVTGGLWMDWGPESMQNAFLYGDFCSGKLWLAKQSGDNWTGHEELTVGTMIVGFGEGLNNELLIFSWAGSIYELADISHSSDLDE